MPRSHQPDAITLAEASFHHLHNTVFHHSLQKRIKLQCANQMQGHPWPTKLSQILDSNSGRIDLHPSRLKTRLIVEFKLQLVIERLREAYC
jgi:hypothetical protein